MATTSIDIMLSAHQKKNSDSGQTFEKRVTKIVESVGATKDVVHGKGITVGRLSKADEFVRPDIRAGFNNTYLDNTELLIDCTNSMRNDRIRAKKFDGIISNSWKQKLYLHVIVFPKAETFKTKYVNYENEIYSCKREVMLQANNIGVCGQSLALMEDDVADFLEAFSRNTDKEYTNIDDMLTKAKEILLTIRPEYKEINFARKYPKYKIK